MRDRSHIDDILRLNDESVAQEEALDKIADKTLQDLKRVYDNAIKPLETLYKYRDLSNRHFGDPEIFSKPLVLLMGPWSGGKSSMINYLTDNEHKDFSLKTGRGHEGNKNASNQDAIVAAEVFKRFFFWYFLQAPSHQHHISIF